MADITKLAEWMEWERWARYYLIPDHDVITEASTMGLIDGTLTPAGAVAVLEHFRDGPELDVWTQTKGLHAGKVTEVTINDFHKSWSATAGDFCTAVRNAALDYLKEDDIEQDN